MSAMDAMHRKVLLTEDVGTPMYAAMLDGFIASTRGTPRTRAMESTPSPTMFPAGWEGHHAAQDMANTLAQAECFYVAPNMVELAVAASESMPDEPILPNDLPADHGFMWLAAPYRCIDVRRKVISFSAVLWAARGGRVRVWALIDKNDPVDSTNVQLRDTPHWQHVAQLGVGHLTHLTFGAELPRGLSWDTPVPPYAKISVGVVHNPDGTTAYTWATDEVVPLHEEPRVTRDPWAAFLLTLWRLCQQSLAERTQEYPDRGLRRRMQRVNVPDKPVTVITLRRRSPSGDAGAEVEWSHRWVVRGHWRMQRCKDTDGQWTTRAIYINPYIKGPEDKPLLVREHVYGLYR